VSDKPNHQNHELILGNQECIKLKRLPFTYDPKLRKRVTTLSCIYFTQTQEVLLSGDEEFVDVTSDVEFNDSEEEEEDLTRTMMTLFAFNLTVAHCPFEMFGMLDNHIFDMIKACRVLKPSDILFGKTEIPLIVCGDFNVDARNYLSSFPQTCWDMEITNTYYTHMNGSRDIVPSKNKIAKFDYILVSKPTKCITWWPNHEVPLHLKNWKLNMMWVF